MPLPEFQQACGDVIIGGLIRTIVESKEFIQLSIFDRLDIRNDIGILGGRGSDIQIVRNSVLRDVENLLNTRRNIVIPPEECRYLQESIFVYGIEDFADKNPRSYQVTQTIKKSIKTTLRRFEPRLRQVTIAFNEDEGNKHNLCFTVTATLFADPVHEPIYFDTWFYVNRGEYKIKDTR